MNVYTALEWAASVLGPQATNGAIDVVALRMADGRINSSPFHVKLSNVSRKGENKVVKLRLNGEPIKLQMKLGRAGEAFFVERTNNDISKRRKQKLECINADIDIVRTEEVPVKGIREEDICSPLQNLISEEESDKCSNILVDQHIISEEEERERKIASLSRPRSFSVNYLTNHNHINIEQAIEASMLKNNTMKSMCTTIDENTTTDTTTTGEPASASAMIAAANHAHTESTPTQTQSPPPPASLITDNNSSSNITSNGVIVLRRSKSLQDIRTHSSKDKEYSNSISLDLKPSPINHINTNINDNNEIAHTGSEHGLGVGVGLQQAQEEPVMPAWTWTWGRLPVKFKAKSCADLESLSVSKTMRRVDDSNSPATKTKTMDMKAIISGGGTMLSRLRLQTVPEGRSEGDDIVPQMSHDLSAMDRDGDGGSSRPLDSTQQHPVVSEYDNTHPSLSLSPLSPTIDSAHILFPRRLLSLCGDILSNNSSNVSIPTNTHELLDVLQTHAIHPRRLCEVASIPSESISQSTLIHRDSRLVVLIDDFLLTWEIAALLLMQEGISLHIDNSNDNDDHAHDHSRYITEESVLSCMTLLRDGGRGFGGDNDNNNNNGNGNDNDNIITIAHENWVGRRASQWQGLMQSHTHTHTPCVTDEPRSIATSPIIDIGEEGTGIHAIDDAHTENKAVPLVHSVEIGTTPSISSVRVESVGTPASPTRMTAMTVPVSAPLPVSTVTTKITPERLRMVGRQRNPYFVSSTRSTFEEYGNSHDDEESEQQHQHQHQHQQDIFDNDPEISVQDISLDDISPQIRRGDTNDDSDTDSYFSLNLDQNEDDFALPLITPEAAAAWSAEMKQMLGDDGSVSARTGTMPGTMSGGTGTGFGTMSGATVAAKKRYKYHKTLIPPQEQLQSLGLRDGVNEISFELEGCPPVKAQIFVWAEDAKVVVVDVEALVTVVGGWTAFMGARRYSLREGVEKLFQAITRNGYQLLLLSSDGTFSKEQLTKAVNIRGPGFPAAPLFTSPDALMRGSAAADPTGVGTGSSGGNGGGVSQRPDIFKASALRGLRSLFPSAHNPFYAGFCGRSIDMIAFSRCDIPKGRIFTVTKKGDVQSFNLTFRKSYQDICNELDLLFPAVTDTLARKKFKITSVYNGKTSAVTSSSSSSTAAVEDSFGDFNFWKIPPAIVER
eukprot:gene1301-2514_t